MGLEQLLKTETLWAYNVASRNVLLLFKSGGPLRTQHLPGGTIPPHDGSGQVHMCFGIAAAELAPWEDRLAEFSVEIEGRTDWPHGARSVHFRDPDEQLLELMTPGQWGIF